MLYPVILALFSIVACTASSRIRPRDPPCDDLHYQCYAPEGEEYDTPSIGPGIKHLLDDLMKSVVSPYTKKRDLEQVGDTLVDRAPSDDVLCCFFGDGCYSLRKWRAPFCYNEHNSDFRLPGGFTGNLNTGRYGSADGDRANLYHGNFILRDGTIGNIYRHGHSPADKGLKEIFFPGQTRASETATTASQTTTTATIATRAWIVEGTTISARTFYPGDTFPAVMRGSSTVLPAVTFPAVIAEGTTIPQRVITATRLETILGEPVSIAVG